MALLSFRVDDEERRAARRRSEERARRERWCAGGRAKVSHPTFGAVIVPCSSKFCAILNAAEFWGCCWTEISGAAVTMPAPEEKKTVRPVEFRSKI